MSNSSAASPPCFSPPAMATQLRHASSPSPHLGCLHSAHALSLVVPPRREKELAAVVIKAADVEVLATEFELDKKVAERRLREHGGSLYEALKSYL